MGSSDETDGHQGTEGLALYGYPQCPYCSRVLKAIEGLELDIPLRNTAEDSDYLKAVYEALGRGTVPVLRIEDFEGEVEWLPESADIIRYLATRFGGGTSVASSGISRLEGSVRRIFGGGSD